MFRKLRKALGSFRLLSVGRSDVCRLHVSILDDEAAVCHMSERDPTEETCYLQCRPTNSDNILQLLA